MWQNWLLAIVSVLLLPTLGALVKIIRLLSVFQEYPPHRHVVVEGKNTIIYPRRMKPEDPEQMDKSAARVGCT